MAEPNEIYESVWNAFLKELPRNPTVTLSSGQEKWHTNRKGMRRWMSNNGLSVKEAKKRIRGCNQYVIENPIPPIPEVADSLFLPMTTDKPTPQSESCDILSGVSLTFPERYTSEHKTWQRTSRHVIPQTISNGGSAMFGLNDGMRYYVCQRYVKMNVSA